MFHQGDLQSGISLAIQEQKLVVCFVRSDDESDCSLWENTYLVSVKETLSSKAVILKIDSDSQGADFLNAFCPISRVPTLVVINNGQVLGKLEGGISKDEFYEGLSAAIGTDVLPKATEPSNEQEIPIRSQDEIVHASTSEQQAGNEPQQQTQEATHSKPGPSKPPEKGKSAVRAATEHKAANISNAAESDGSKTRTTGEIAEKEKARQSWIMQQKQRKDEARQERKRILDQIERDKQERKARAHQEKATNEATGPSEPLKSVTSTSSSRNPGSSTSGGKGYCNLQVRLFDGSSIRKRFESSTTLASGVREWIKTASAASASTSEPSPTAPANDIPYTFRQILAPAPSRSIEISEEHQSLLDLDLVPNATLVLVPVSGYTDAYASGNGGGYVGAATGAAYGVLSGVSRIVSAALSYVPGFAPESANSGNGGGGGGGQQTGGGVAAGAGAGAGATAATATMNNEENGSGSAKVKVKTLADQRAEAAARKGERQAEFYNGNSSAFEGRKDDE